LWLSSRTEKERNGTMKTEEHTYSVGERVRFTYPNQALGTGTITEINKAHGKAFTITLDKPWSRVRAGKTVTDATAYASTNLIEAA
jgi:hypothetical protein